MSRTSFQAPYVPDTISASEMQRLQPSLYPSDIPSIAGEPFNFSDEDSNWWTPDPTSTLPTVNPSFLATSGASGINPYLNDTQPSNIFDKQFQNSRRKSSDEAQFKGSTYHVRHGQFTPPSDQSPSATFSASKPQPSVQTSIEDSEPPAKRRRSTRVRGDSRGSSARASASVEPASPGDERQDKTRARNRLAASKCRQKKKEQNSKLETKYEQEKLRNEELTRTVNWLRDEIVAAKTQLLAHSECGHESVQSYIQGMAKNLAGPRENEQADSGCPQFQGCGPEHKLASLGFDFDPCPPTA